MQPIRASELLATLKPSGILDELRGPDVSVLAIAAAGACAAGDLTFVENKEHVEGAVRGKPAVIVTIAELAGRFPGATLLIAKNVRLAHAHIGQGWFDRDLSREGWPRIHPSAVVHETASVAATAVIGPNAVVGARTKIGEGAVILAGAVVEHDVVIGERAVIHPTAIIGWGSEIGPRAIIKAGTSIGSEGFGFAQDAQRKSHRVPHLGRVVIGENAVIGSRCCVDRGTFGLTQIGAGTIMDNLVHIAHNVEVGEDCIITAATVIAGSSKLGKRVITSGQTGMVDHVTVADDVVLVQRAGVANDVKEAGVYAGSPLLPLKEYRKNLAVFAKLAELRDTVRDLQHRISAMESGKPS